MSAGNAFCPRCRKDTTFEEADGIRKCAECGYHQISPTHRSLQDPQGSGEGMSIGEAIMDVGKVLLRVVLIMIAIAVIGVGVLFAGCALLVAGAHY